MSKIRVKSIFILTLLVSLRGKVKVAYIIETVWTVYRPVDQQLMSHFCAPQRDVGYWLHKLETISYSVNTNFLSSCIYLDHLWKPRNWKFLLFIELNQIIFNQSWNKHVDSKYSTHLNISSFDSNVHRFLGFQGDDFWSRGRSIPPFPIKPSMTSCPAKRPRVTNSRAELRLVTSVTAVGP